MRGQDKFLAGSHLGNIIQTRSSFVDQSQIDEVEMLDISQLFEMDRGVEEEQGFPTSDRSLRDDKLGGEPLDPDEEPHILDSFASDNLSDAESAITQEHLQNSEMAELEEHDGSRAKIEEDIGHKSLLPVIQLPSF